ncbi:hypothetical protein [Streptomyces sp. NPDC018584]|uniref:hypothetical protein n=1 Tax=unclassified Streptomyces TaxID=2593676 RepID=UPI003797E024
MEPRDHMRWEGKLLVLDGTYGSTYNVDTINSIDANLESLRYRPDHPDINRLLDARLHVAVLNSIWPPSA